MSGEVYALIDLGWDNNPEARPKIDAALKGCTHKREHTVKGPPFKGTERGDGLVVGGCGMDMGFHLVYSLGRVLFREGFRVEGIWRNGDTSGHDKDGGYALKQEWL